MRIDVDAWDPAYGAELETGGRGPAAQSDAQLATDVEVPADAWQPLVAAPDVRAPDTVLLVDGVRRIDAGVWVTDDATGDTHRGLAVSYAAGVVRCDLRAGYAEVAAARIARGLFTPSPGAESLSTGRITYTAHRVRGEEHLIDGVQAQLQALEVGVSEEARAGSDDLLVVDGPLRSGRMHLPYVLGYVKTHRVEYLPRELSTVVTQLRAGQRSPVFDLGSRWRRHAWYLRLPGTGGGPWAGVVRVECAADLPVNRAVELADLSAVTLPRFASTPYKDPRAPQNLVPVAGLERRLRGLLGDARLLHRSLVLAARRPVPVP